MEDLTRFFRCEEQTPLVSLCVYPPELYTELIEVEKSLNRALYARPTYLAFKY